MNPTNFLPVGFATQLAPMYLLEITPYNLKGAFGTLNQLFITLGIFMSSVFGLREILGQYILCILLILAALIWKAASSYAWCA